MIMTLKQHHTYQFTAGFDQTMYLAR